MALLDDVKINLRESSKAFDVAEITPIIEACKIDMKDGGVSSTRIDGLDALITRAIILYCKANFGYDENAERFQKEYEKLKISLALAGD
jgi:hypothetical protein